MFRRIQGVGPQKFALLDVEKVDEFLVEERVEFLVEVLLKWFHSLDLLVWEQIYAGQRFQYLIELLQVLVVLLHYLDL